MSELVKDRECIHCEKFFDCQGKPRGSICVNFEERKKDDGRNIQERNKRNDRLN